MPMFHKFAFFRTFGSLIAAFVVLTTIAPSPADATLFGDLSRRWAALNSPVAMPSEPVVARCVIGKISYCGKYGGALCERSNSSPSAKADCARWTRACLACHNEMPGCLGGTRTNVAASRCTRCKNRWGACMMEADGNFWPNRSAGIKK